MDLIRQLPQPRNKKAHDGMAVADGGLGSFKMVGGMQKSTSTALATRTSGPPPYGKRNGWLPKCPEDYGDGGAFPELHMAQYPLEMGRKRTTVSKTVPLQVDSDGRVAWDAVLRQGEAGKRLAVYSRPEDGMEKWTNPEEMQRPGQELDELNTSRTQQALELALNKKISAGVPQSQTNKAPEYVRYTPNKDTPGYNAACEQRVVKIVEKQIDPLEPPKFKHKKVPKGPPTPPPPIVHSPARKLTQKDQKEWKIPPCISNWKNVKGYTIPLDKRLSADGRNLQDVTVNDKFAALSEDLYLAERKAREEIKIRNDMVRQKKVREEEIREGQLRELAAQARSAKQDLASGERQTGETEEDAAARRKRMEVLNERKREIERDRRMEVAGKKQKRDRDDDRDIGEKIALGQMAQPTSQESLYDARLFNQSAGMDSGFRGGDDEHYTAYDKALFADRTKAGIYKHDKERVEQAEGRLASIGSSSSRKTKTFSGADDDAVAGGRTAPVEFEREEDPFGLDNLISEAKSKKRDR